MVGDDVQVRDGVDVAFPFFVGVRDLVGDLVGPAGVFVAGADVRVAVNTAPGVPTIANTKPSPIAIWVMLLRPAGIAGKAVS